MLGCVTADDAWEGVSDVATPMGGMINHGLVS